MSPVIRSRTDFSNSPAIFSLNSRRCSAGVASTRSDERALSMVSLRTPSMTGPWTISRTAVGSTVNGAFATAACTSGSRRTPATTSSRNLVSR